MTDYIYNIHGVNLRLATDSPAIADAARTLLRQFPEAPLTEAADLECRFMAVESRSDIPWVSSEESQTLFTNTGSFFGDPDELKARCTVYREDETITVDFDEQGLWQIRDRLVDGYLVRPEATHPLALASFFHLAMMELLKQIGLYTIHATSLERDGRGILIPGSSGRGKTTLCLSLLRSGYRYLSDDHPLLRDTDRGLELLGLNERIDVTEDTIEFFPELRDAGDALQSGVLKRYFYVEDVYSQVPAESCSPSFIIFPQVIDWPKSHLEPLSKSRALELLLPTGLLVYDKEVARRQFQIMSRLVNQAECYQLNFGEDILEAPRLVDEIFGMVAR
ncbi:MAG: hypothetical protein ACE5Q6_01530 [Dehalococcoidia bacterium]